MKKLKELLETVSSYEPDQWIYAREVELDSEAMICTDLSKLDDWKPIATLEQVIDSRSSWHEGIDVEVVGIDEVWMYEFLEELNND